MDGIRYKEYEMQLEKGATLFLYTDGVPEATDGQNAMYGTERLLSVMNKQKAQSTKQLLENIRESVDEFVGGSEQFDDLTVLAVRLL